jgi:hypothetical protein
MTKKELTSLLVAFLGGWLIVEMVVSLVMPLTTTLTGIWTATGGHFDSLVFGILLSLVPSLLYGLLAWLIIARSNWLADYLLRYARIQGEEKIEGIGLAGLSPLLFSMLGLYFMIAYAPSFAISGVRWFALNARSGGLGNMGRETIELSQMINDALVFGLALFVFRRPDLLVGLVQRPTTRENDPQGPKRQLKPDQENQP